MSTIFEQQQALSTFTDPSLIESSIIAVIQSEFTNLSQLKLDSFKNMVNDYGHEVDEKFDEFMKTHGDDSGKIGEQIVKKFILKCEKLENKSEYFEAFLKFAKSILDYCKKVEDAKKKGTIEELIENIKKETGNENLCESREQFQPDEDYKSYEDYLEKSVFATALGLPDYCMHCAVMDRGICMGKNKDYVTIYEVGMVEDDYICGKCWMVSSEDDSDSEY